MKKFILTVMMVSLFNSVCFAQMLKTPPKAKAAAPKPAAAPMPSLDITGTIKSVSMADAAKGTSASIVVADNMGKESTLAVLPSTLIMQSGKPATIDKIAKNDNVRVRYRENKGVKAAVTIQIAGK